MTKARELADLIANVNHGSSLANKNLLINSSFAVNQRGASTVTSGYFLDRWTITSASATAQLTSSLPDGFSYGMSIAATSGNPIASQRIEAKNLENISGKIVTLSFYAKDLGNVGALYASLQTANSADSFGGTTTISEQTLTSDVPTSWTKYTCSWTVPAAGLNGLALNILCAGSSTFTLGIVAPQLEIGEKATEFEHEPFETTLAKCQRYYIKYQAGSAYSYLGSGQVSAATTARIVFQFPTEMNHVPALEQSANNTLNVYATDSEAFSADATINNPSNHSSAITCTVSSGLIAKAGASVVANNSTSAYLAFESEL